MITLSEKTLARNFQPHLILFEELDPYYFTIYDRELAFNQDQLRNFIIDLIHKKRKLLKENPDNAKKGDLLTIMLQDPLFENDDQ